MKQLLAVLLILTAIGCASARRDNTISAPPDGVIVKRDRKFGDCYSEVVLSDFVVRYPPVNAQKFSMEINFIPDTDEIEVFHYGDEFAEDGKSQPIGPIAYYDGKTCAFLRAETGAPKGL